MSARGSLRSATREAHDRLDAMFAAYDLGRRDDYIDFLTAHAAAFVPVERELDGVGAGRLVEGWDDHRRSPLILSDLAALGVEPSFVAEPPSFDSDAAILGGAYVLEGSRLGAAVLVRQVGPGLPSAFLSAPQTPGRWKRFTQGLERTLASTVERELAQQAAIDTFRFFERSAHLTMSNDE